MSLDDYPNIYQPTELPPGIQCEVTNRFPEGSLTDAQVVGRFYLRDQGPFSIEVAPPDQGSEHLAHNLEFLARNFDGLVANVISWADSIRQHYGHDQTPYDEASRLEVTLPEERLSTETEWSIWLHDGLAGWLVDLIGVKPVGGQGVF